MTVHDTADICVRILGLDLGSDCITVEGNSEGSSRDSHKSELADAVASNHLFFTVFISLTTFFMFTSRYCCLRSTFSLFNFSISIFVFEPVGTVASNHFLEQNCEMFFDENI